MNRALIGCFLERWTNLHPFVRFLALTSAALLAWVGVVKPGYGLFKGWRLERNLSAAQQALNGARMDEARDLSLSVLKAGDSGIEVFRILEKSAASLRDPRHADIARALITHPQGTVEDRLKGFRGNSRDVALGLLGQAWSLLPEECHQEPRFATALAERLIAERRLSQARTVLLAVPEAARTPAVDRCLIEVLIGSDQPENYAEAQRLIAGKMPVDDLESSGWLELLEQIPVGMLRADVLGPVRKLLEAPACGDSARLALMLTRLDYAANFSRREVLLEMAIARWKDREPEALARFLDDLGHYQLLLDNLPTERVREHPGLFPHLLKAIARRGDWQRLGPLLDADGQRLPRFEEVAYRAVVAAKTSDATTRQQAWTAAMSEAKSSPVLAALLTISRVAKDAGMPDEAGQAMVEAIRRGRGPLPLYADLKPLLKSLTNQGRENTLLEICTTYLRFEPENPVLLAQYAYLACLTQLVDPGPILEAMEVLAKGYPKELSVQCALATIYLCARQYDQAAATLDRLEADPATLTPGFRAAHLTIQVLTHRLPKNDPRIIGFPWQSLQASERRQFSEMIRAAKP
jgi:hypothetical protein